MLKQSSLTSFLLRRGMGGKKLIKTPLLNHLTEGLYGQVNTDLTAWATECIIQPYSIHKARI